MAHRAFEVGTQGLRSGTQGLWIALMAVFVAHRAFELVGQWR